MFKPTQNTPTRIEIIGDKPVAAVHLGDGKDSAFHVVIEGFSETGLGGSDESSLLSGSQGPPATSLDRTLGSMEKVSMQEKKSVERSGDKQFQRPIHFDATERRRSRMKENAAKPMVPQSHSPETLPVDHEVVDNVSITKSQKIFSSTAHPSS